MSHKVGNRNDPIILTLNLRLPGVVLLRLRQGQGTGRELLFFRSMVLWGLLADLPEWLRW